MNFKRKMNSELEKFKDEIAFEGGNQGKQKTVKSSSPTRKSLPKSSLILSGKVPVVGSKNQDLSTSQSNLPLHLMQKPPEMPMLSSQASEYSNDRFEKTPIRLNKVAQRNGSIIHKESGKIKLKPRRDIPVVN